MHKNTYGNGILTFISYPTAKNTYNAACEELCLVREGKNLKNTKKSILADAKLYLKDVCENRLGEHLLNQSLPTEIIKEFKNYKKATDLDEDIVFNYLAEKSDKKGAKFISHSLNNF